MNLGLVAAFAVLLGDPAPSGADAEFFETSIRPHPVWRRIPDSRRGSSPSISPSAVSGAASSAGPPTAEGNNGREHHPFGFTMWLAGGGIKGGYVHGATDEFGRNAARDKVHVHDLHATLLHLIGIDHTRLTYRFGGRDYRQTDVYGEVVNPVIA